jgi:glycerol kinase
VKTQYILSIDQGTTGTTVLLIDNFGRIVYESRREFAQSFPRPGWVEHDPNLIWQTVTDCLCELRRLPQLADPSTVAVGITNQRETVVVWDRESGEPVHPAIVWQCRRTADACLRLRDDGIEDMVRSKTGLRLDPYFSATKIQWILRNVPGAMDLARAGRLACGTIDSWLIYKLTGGKVHATDHSNACRTMLYNIHSRDFDPDLLDLFEIPASLMPEIRESNAHFGCVQESLLGREIPITGVVGDQQSALFGQACTRPGLMKNTYGTGCFLLMNTGSEPVMSESGLLTSVGWVIDGHATYVLEGSVFMAGALVKWLRDELGILQSAAESESLAKSVPDSAGVYLVPAFTGLGAPHWDPYARGILVGLSRGVTKAHVVRAALEGIAYQVNDVIEAMRSEMRSHRGGQRPCDGPLLRVDGGASANGFLMQFQADISQVQIQRNKSVELTGIGAAFMAGLGCGLLSSVDEFAGLVEPAQTFQPSMDQNTRRLLLSGWERAVGRAKGWQPAASNSDTA